MKTKQFFKALTVVGLVTIFLSFTSKSDRQQQSNNVYYYFYYEMVTNDYKWIYISDLSYGERPGKNLTVPAEKDKKRFINRVKEQYGSQASAFDKYYIDDRVNYSAKSDKEDARSDRNDRIKIAKDNDYKVFYVVL